MQAFRSALTTCQRQGVHSARRLVSQRSLSVAAATTAPASPTVTPPPPSTTMLSAEDWLQNIRSLAEQRRMPIKKTKLTSFLKAVTTSEQLEASKEIMRIFETKRIDPDASAAGVLVKKALEFNKPNLVFDMLQANSRIGLFVESTTFNKLLCKFFKNGEYDKVYQLYEIGVTKYDIKSTDRTFDILIRTAIEQGDYDRAVEWFRTAAESNKLMRVTCNNLLFKLQEQQLQDKIDEVAALMKAAGVKPNDTTKKVVQSDI